MENRILSRLRYRLGAGEKIDPAWLFTLLSVLDLNTYTLEEWNQALTVALGRKIHCPSYGTLAKYLHRVVLEVK